MKCFNRKSRMGFSQTDLALKDYYCKGCQKFYYLFKSSFICQFDLSYGAVKQDNPELYFGIKLEDSFLCLGKNHAS